MKKLETKFIQYFIVTSGLFLIFNDCRGKESEHDPGIVSYAGEFEITVRDFRLNYEFGFSLLKRKIDRKYSYLKYMINHYEV